MREEHNLRPSLLALKTRLKAKYATAFAFMKGFSERKMKLSIIQRLAALPATVPNYVSSSGTLHRYALSAALPYTDARPSPTFLMNNFVRESLRAIGGGAYKISLEAENYIRISGGRRSIHNNLLRYENASTIGCIDTLNAMFTIDDVCNELFGSEKLNPLTFDELLKTYRVNTTASAGSSQLISSRRLSRGYYISSAMDDLAGQLRQWYEYPCNIFSQWRFTWSISTRGKLIGIDDAIEKLLSDQPVSRVVSLPHPCEHFLCYPMYMPLNKLIITRLRYFSQGSICIGIRKNKYDWRVLGKTLSKFRYTLCVDWSRFDTTVSRDLMLYAFYVMRNCFNYTLPSNQNYFDNIFSFFRNNVVFSRYVYDGFIYDTDGGIPSGSIWTSILGSIVNFVVLKYIFTKINVVTDFKIYVYGDDGIVGFNTVKPLNFSSRSSRRNLARMTTSTDHLIYMFNTIAQEKFGLKMSISDTYISDNENFCVGYRVPVFSSYSREDLLSGTGNKKPTSYLYPDTPFYVVDYDKGITHRWEYNFQRRPKFLKRYWDKWFRPIAPTFETISHLVNPERPIKNITMYRDVLLSQIADNIHNLHVFNYGFHLFYDYFFLCKLPKNSEGTSVSDEYSLFDSSTVYYEYIHTKRDDSLPFNDNRVFYRRSTKYVSLINDLRTSSYYKLYHSLLKKRTKSSDQTIELSHLGRDAYIDQILLQEDALLKEWQGLDVNWPLKSTAQRYISFYLDKRNLYKKGAFDSVIDENMFKFTDTKRRVHAFVTMIASNSSLQFSYLSSHWSKYLLDLLYDINFSNLCLSTYHLTSFPFYIYKCNNEYTYTELKIHDAYNFCVGRKIGKLSPIISYVYKEALFHDNVCPPEVNDFFQVFLIFRKIIDFLSPFGIFNDEQSNEFIAHRHIKALVKMSNDFFRYSETQKFKDLPLSEAQDLLERYIIKVYKTLLASRKRSYTNIFSNHLTETNYKNKLRRRNTQL